MLSAADFCSNDMRLHKYYKVVQLYMLRPHRDQRTKLARNSHGVKSRDCVSSNLYVNINFKNATVPTLLCF